MARLAGHFRRWTPLVLILFLPSFVASQEPAGYAHQDAELGRVDFPVSCNAEASRRFEHAMGVLHSFWWEEGDKAFQAVLQADSTCSMARQRPRGRERPTPAPHARPAFLPRPPRSTETAIRPAMRSGSRRMPIP